MTKSFLYLMILTTILNSSCKHDAAPSDPKFGFLKVWTKNLMIIEDGQTIGICGAHFDELKSSILKWGAAIGRSYEIRKTCTAGQYQVSSFAADTAFAIKSCKESGSSNRMFTNSSDIVYMVDCNKAADRVPFSVLHEVGHMYGLCDQYAEGISNCVTTTAVVEGSVMKSAITMELTQDDIEGLRVLAALQTKSDGGALQTITKGSYGSEIGSSSLIVESQIEADRMVALVLKDGNGERVFTCTKTNVCAYLPTEWVDIVSESEFILRHLDGRSQQFRLQP